MGKEKRGEKAILLCNCDGKSLPHNGWRENDERYEGRVLPLHPEERGERGKESSAFIRGGEKQPRHISDEETRKKQSGFRLDGRTRGKGEKRGTRREDLGLWRGKVVGHKGRETATTKGREKIFHHFMPRKRELRRQ